MKLSDGSKVVIVGGGPAGSFTALHLQKYAAESDLNLDISIIEPRDFHKNGPGGCNKCAGILSSQLVQNLETLQLSLPAEVIQSEITCYVLHINGTEMTIHHPDPEQRILSVYRGSGPRMGVSNPQQSFDGWLLSKAQERGAAVQRGRVRTILQGPKPVVVTAREEIQADLVVLATGVNTRAPLEQAWGYRHPTTEIMAQDELPLPPGFSKKSVHIYFDHPPGLIFGGVIPKGRYANISLLGHHIPPDAINDFLEGHGLMNLFPNGSPGLCGCLPRVAVSMAANFFHDGLVAVGDAAVTRLYKDGIGSAFLTAQAAAQTAISRGITLEDFNHHYRPTCQHISTDNQYGRWLFRLWAITQKNPVMVDIWQRAVEAEFDMPATSHIHTRVLWGMFTGSESYQQLLKFSFSWKALSSLMHSAIQQWRDS